MKTIPRVRVYMTGRDCRWTASDGSESCGHPSYRDAYRDALEYLVSSLLLPDQNGFEGDFETVFSAAYDIVERLPTKVIENYLLAHPQGALPETVDYP